MSTTTNRTRHTTVALKLPLSVPALITYARGIVTRMTANPSFPNPTPTLAAVTAAIDDLQAAETAALARTKGAVATRNDKRAALVALLQQLRGYIQATADADAANGAAIIESAGVAVRKTPTRHARVFAAKPGRRLRDGEGRRRIGGPARVVRVAVQHRRRQDVDRGAGHAAGQDDHRGPRAGSDGAVQVPGGDQDGRGRLEPAGVARDSLSGPSARSENRGRCRRFEDRARASAVHGAPAVRDSRGGHHDSLFRDLAATSLRSAQVL